MRTEAAVEGAASRLVRIRREINKVIVGQQDVIDGVLICLLSGGHVLLEGVPGLGKTTLLRTLARALHLRHSRIQFTPDLMPADIIGSMIIETDERGAKALRFQPGPVFANLVLADEINRATPKTQSALLEVMDRGKVTIDGEAHAVGTPFMVLATQNPVDYEGTFPLPESQLDRFLMRIRMGYPQAADELEILRNPHMTYDSMPLNPVVTREQVLRLQELVGQVFVEESVLDFVLMIVAATRTEAEFKAGISVRGGVALKRAAQARALLGGRDFVLPEDVLDLVLPVFGHRLALVRPTSDALEERNAVAAVLRRILGAIPVPV